MPRGGKRSGTPGQAYPNRTDLNSAPRVASGVRSEPVYGTKAAQAAAVQAVPMASAPPPVTPLDAPTQRPNEPVTAGLPVGGGPGPEALMFQPTPEMDPGVADLENLRAYLPALERLAGLPTASVATRNFIRRMRGGAG